MLIENVIELTIIDTIYTLSIPLPTFVKKKEAINNISMPINKYGFNRGFWFSFLLAQIIPIGKHKIVFHHIDDKLHKTDSEIKVNVSNRII